MIRNAYGAIAVAALALSLIPLAPARADDADPDAWPIAICGYPDGGLPDEEIAAVLEEQGIDPGLVGDFSNVTYLTDDECAQADDGSDVGVEPTEEPTPEPTETEEPPAPEPVKAATPARVVAPVTPAPRFGRPAPGM